MEGEPYSREEVTRMLEEDPRLSPTARVALWDAGSVILWHGPLAPARASLAYVKEVLRDIRAAQDGTAGQEEAAEAVPAGRIPDMADGLDGPPEDLGDIF